MPLIKAEFGLTKDQIANINIASVAVTILVRLIIGPLCDKYGPRRAYTLLLAAGAIPVFGLAFAQSYEFFCFSASASAPLAPRVSSPSTTPA